MPANETGTPLQQESNTQAVSAEPKLPPFEFFGPQQIAKEGTTAASPVSTATPLDAGAPTSTNQSKEESPWKPKIVSSEGNVAVPGATVDTTTQTAPTPQASEVPVTSAQTDMARPANVVDFPAPADSRPLNNVVPFPQPPAPSSETTPIQSVTATTSNEGNMAGLTPYPDVTDTSNNQKGDSSASLFAGNTPPAEAAQPAPVDATATVAPEIPAPTPINVEAAATTDSKATIPASTESGTAPATTPDVNSSLPPESASFLSSLGYGTGAEANSAGADNEPKAETPVHKEINPQAAMKGLGEQIKKAEEEEKELDIEKVNKEKLKKAKLLFFSILQDMDPVTQKNLLEDIFNLLYSTDINQFKQTEEKKAA